MQSLGPCDFFATAAVLFRWPSVSEDLSGNDTEDIYCTISATCNSRCTSDSNGILSDSSAYRWHAVAWLTHCAASLKVRVSIPDRTFVFVSVILILKAALWPWGQHSLQQKRVPEIIVGMKGQPAHKADNLTAICEPLFQKDAW
jgi:hypothetical protein